MKADLILLTVAIVWGSAFVAQRVAAGQIGVFLFNGLRFLIGALILIPLAWRQSRTPGRRLDLSSQDVLSIALVGMLLFIAAALQQLGLRFTTAGNAGFITGLYVVLVPLFLAFGWRQWPRPSIWPASLLAAAGLFLLSTGGRLALNPGDGFELAGAAVWALHVILIGRLVQRIEVLHLAIGQYLVCGLLSLGAGMVLENTTWTNLGAVWWTVVYTGIFSIGLGYTLQAVGQKAAPAADAAILLSMEAVFAALFGWLLLSEGLIPLQMLGSGLMLAGMVLAQVRST
jgi:drug/metabolite transporter (DMT)-like permease